MQVANGDDAGKAKGKESARTAGARTFERTPSDNTAQSKDEERETWLVTLFADAGSWPVCRDALRIAEFLQAWKQKRYPANPGSKASS